MKKWACYQDRGQTERSVIHQTGSDGVCSLSPPSVSHTDAQNTQMLSSLCIWVLWSWWVTIEAILVTNNFSIFEIVFIQCFIDFDALRWAPWVFYYSNVNTISVIIDLFLFIFLFFFFLAAWLTFGWENLIKSLNKTKQKENRNTSA